jgi:hypothetical protein
MHQLPSRTTSQLLQQHRPASIIWIANLSVYDCNDPATGQFLRKLKKRSAPFWHGQATVTAYFFMSMYAKDQTDDSRHKAAM